VLQVAADRICPDCMTQYSLLAEAEGRARVHQEQRLSGICSMHGWVRLNGPDGFDPKEWLGTAASVTVAKVGDQLHVLVEKKQ
jgi:hypothetical protein